MSEFYGLTETILRPEVALQIIKKGGEKHKNYLEMEKFVATFGK